MLKSLLTGIAMTTAVAVPCLAEDTKPEEKPKMEHHVVHHHMHHVTVHHVTHHMHHEMKKMDEKKM